MSQNNNRLAGGETFSVYWGYRKPQNGYLLLKKPAIFETTQTG
jgi:hypothetical protein